MFITRDLTYNLLQYYLTYNLLSNLHCAESTLLYISEHNKIHFVVTLKILFDFASFH